MIICLVPYQDILTWQVKKMVEESTLKFDRIIYFSEKELVENYPEYENTVDAKIMIVMEKYKPDYLCIFSINARTETNDLQNMFNTLQSDSKAHSIGVWGDYFGEKNNIVQETNWKKCTNVGRPGIYKAEIYWKYLEQAKKDTKLRCGSYSELFSHIGHLAKIDGYHPIIYSKYLMNGHLTQKSNSTHEDFCRKCNAHKSALEQVCIFKDQEFNYNE